MHKILLRDRHGRGHYAFFYVMLLLFTLPFVFAACSANAGVFSGGSWQANGLVHQRIRTLAVDSSNPQAVYAGGAGGSILVSSDSGQHWSEHGTGPPVAGSLHPAPAAINAIAFDATGKKLYAATTRGLFVSADAARHWQNVSAPIAGLTAGGYVALAFDLHAPHTIYVAASNDIFVSRDEARSWSALGLRKLAPAASSINGLAFDSGNLQLWAATTTGVYRFDRRGAGWRALNNGLPRAVNVYAVQPASISGGTAGLVFAGTNRGFYRSADGGAHWAQSQQSLARTSVHALLVDFRNPATVYVGTVVGVLRSDDGGQTWGGTGPGLPRQVTVSALLLGASNYAQLFAATGDVYMFPGTGSQLSLVRLLPILFVALCFYILYRLTRGSRRGKRDMLKPGRISERTGRPEDADRSRPGNRAV